MRNAALRLPLIAGLGIALACAPAGSPRDTSAMVAAADALDAAFLEAFNAGDAAAISSLYWNSPDVVSFPPDAFQVRGFAAISEAYALAFTDSGGAGVQLEFAESHQIPAGDKVIGWGLWRMRVAIPGADTLVLEGRYTDVKQEVDGKWVYILDHASVPMPPM